MKISNEVLAVLSVVDVEGANVIIPMQLERKLYLQTNEALLALGGKWNRKAKAHVFTGDARALLDGAIMSGDVITARDLGFFPTPEPIARELVLRVGGGGLDGKFVLEPSAGEGALVDAALMAGAAGVVAIERDTRRRAMLRVLPYPRLVVMGTNDIGAVVDDGGNVDFLDVTIGDATALLPAGAYFDAVVMNPPFCKVGLGDHLDHVRHAFGFLRAGGVLASILPNGVLFREDRRHREFREWALDHGGELRELPEQAFRSSGTDVRTCTLRMVRS